MRSAALCIGLVGLASCVDDGGTVSRAQAALTVFTGATSSRRLGTSLAGCGSTIVVGSQNVVSPLFGALPATPPSGAGLGAAVACDADGLFAASAPGAGFVWVTLPLLDGGFLEEVIDAGALMQPGATLAVRKAGQAALVAAGAPGHGCGGGGCLGGLQVWLVTTFPRQVLERINAPGLSAGEELGRGVAFGARDGGHVLGVISQRQLAVFDVNTGALERTSGGPTGVTSIAFGTFSQGRAFVLGQAGASQVTVVGVETPTTVAQIIPCEADAGLGAVVTAFDWDGDQLSDVVMSNPAANRVDVALSRRGYLCERLPLPSPAVLLAGFGQSLAGAMGANGPVLAVGAPTSSLNFQPLSGAVAVFELCDLASQASRCQDAGTPDGGSSDGGADAGDVDAGQADGGFDAGAGPDSGVDAGLDAGGFDAGAAPDSGVDAGLDAGTAPDAGSGLDAGGPAASVDAGAQRADGGAPTDVLFVPVSCGCSSGHPLLLAFSLSLLVRRRRR